MGKPIYYYSVARIRFSFLKKTGQVEARIYLKGQSKPQPVATGIQGTKKQWNARNRPDTTGETKRFIFALLNYEMSILQTARLLTQSGQPVTIPALLQAYTPSNLFVSHE